MSKYNEFIGLTVENKGIFKANQSDVVYNCFIKNEITDLKKLFCLDDNNMIDYGTDKRNTAEIKGVIKLLRNKYLNEPLNIEPILNKTLNSSDIQFDVLIRSLGFNKKETRILLNNKYLVLNEIDNYTCILDLLKGNYEYILKQKNSSTFNLLNKLNTVISSTNTKEQINTDIDKLTQLKEELKKMKDSQMHEVKKIK